MVALFAERAGNVHALPYLAALEKEYGYWMDGASALAPGQAFRRVVRLADGSLLNRYWDDQPEPRPESYREDVLTATGVAPADRGALYRNIRATAESGWDFSSRWMRDRHDLTTLETVDLVPVDLNSILFETERTIATLRSVRQQSGDRDVAQRFADAADRRRRVLVAASYDPVEGFFFDVRWRTSARVIDRPTMAAAARVDGHRRRPPIRPRRPCRGGRRWLARVEPADVPGHGQDDGKVRRSRPAAACRRR